MTEAEFLSLIAPRDRTHIYNLRKINLSLATEYLLVMQVMVDKATTYPSFLWKEKKH